MSPSVLVITTVDETIPTKTKTIIANGYDCFADSMALTITYIATKTSCHYCYIYFFPAKFTHNINNSCMITLLMIERYEIPDGSVVLLKFSEALNRTNGC